MSEAEKAEFRFDLECQGAPPEKIEERLAEADNEGTVFLLEEHWEAWEMYRRVRTQWRYGSRGKEGLDYNPLFKVMDLKQIDPERQLELLAQIQLIESGILDQRQIEIEKLEQAR